MTYATKVYVQEVLGHKYTNFRPPEFIDSFKETTCRTPVFFILSAGVDPTRVNITLLSISFNIYNVQMDLTNSAWS